VGRGDQPGNDAEPDLEDERAAHGEAADEVV
jgi:hypothetical protein